MVRYQHNVIGITGGKAFEEAYAKEKLPETPQLVSPSSSIHGVKSGAGIDPDDHDVDMMAGIKSDFVRLTAAPKFAEANGRPNRIPLWKRLPSRRCPNRLSTWAWLA
jgi:hypothetical protein